MLISKEKIIRRILLALFWIWGLYGFVSDEILPVLADMRSILYLLFDVAFVALGIATLKNKKDVVLISAFVVISFISTIMVNKLGIVNWLNGMRDFFGLLFALPIFRYFFEDDGRRRRFITTFDKYLISLLIVQVPCMVFQFLKYGANDHGGGSLGNGYSGVISTLIYISSFYLVTRDFDRTKYFKSLKKNIWYVVLLFPTFLNETKISFLLIFLYFLLLMKFDKALIMRLAIAMPLFLTGIYFVFSMYMSATASEEDITDISYYTEAYLLTDDNDQLIELAERLDEGEFGDEDDWGIDLPRFSRILLMPAVTARSDGGVVFGAGLSQFKGKSYLQQTKFAQEFEWFVNGTIIFSQVVFSQLGLIGVVWFIILLANVFMYKVDDNRKRDRYITFYLLFIFSILMVYDQSMRYPIFCLIAFYVVIMGGLNKKEGTNLGVSADNRINTKLTSTICNGKNAQHT